MSMSGDVRVYPCESWEDFLVKIRPAQKGKFVGGYLYRGHAQPDWKLSSQWERRFLRMKEKDSGRNVRELFSEGAYEKIRDSYLSRFKERAVGIPGMNTETVEDENEWWALGRHYGLLTPLLDWTRSPYIAAFFAFRDYCEQLNPGFKSGTRHFFGGGIQFGTAPVVVWVLSTIARELIRPGEFQVIDLRKEVFYRQRAQEGLFTRLTHAVHVDLESYLESQGLATYLERYEIPGQAMGTALADLELMGITYARLFPDLHGAAMHANSWDSLSGLR